MTAELRRFEPVEIREEQPDPALARAANASQRAPGVGEHREKLGKLRLLTPSARVGRMGPQ